MCWLIHVHVKPSQTDIIRCSATLLKSLSYKVGLHHSFTISRSYASKSSTLIKLAISGVQIWGSVLLQPQIRLTGKLKEGLPALKQSCWKNWVSTAVYDYHFQYYGKNIISGLYIIHPMVKFSWIPSGTSDMRFHHLNYEICHKKRRPVT